jgi:hypothetical protein
MITEQNFVFGAPVAEFNDSKIKKLKRIPCKYMVLKIIDKCLFGFVHLKDVQPNKIWNRYEWIKYVRKTTFAEDINTLLNFRIGTTIYEKKKNY